jgi:hypothetical protein
VCLVDDEMDGTVGRICDNGLMAVVIVFGEQQRQNLFDFVVAATH